MAWAPDYTTLSELKSFLRIGDSGDDVELASAITAASRAVDNRTNRQFGKVAAGEARTYKGWWNRHRNRWIVEHDDLMDLTGLTVATVGGTITVYTFEPVNAVLKGKVFTQLIIDPASTVVPASVDEYKVTMTGLWGWTAVPVAVKEATLLQASRFHARRFSPFGVAGSPDAGSELRLLSRVDPDVAVSLTDYVRWWV